MGFTGVRLQPQENDSKNNFSEIIKLLLNKGISIRFRIARNFRNHPYGKPNEDLIEYIDRFLQLRECREFQSFGFLHTFDEDHIRAEYYLDLDNLEYTEFPSIFFDKKIFDFKLPFGFLTACPTNSGRANKVSLKIPIASIENTNFKNIFKTNYKELISYVDESFIIIFVKNFNDSRLRNFFYFILNNL